MTEVQMPDVFDKATRSEVMSRIRGKGNQNTEIALLRLMRSQRITGWRRGQPVYGRPDFVFRRQRLAVFVDGCFWHGCPRHCKQPKTNRAFWMKKLSANKQRDRLVTRTLRGDGWTVIRLWECQLATAPSRCIGRIVRALNRNSLMACAGQRRGHVSRNRLCLAAGRLNAGPPTY